MLATQRHRGCFDEIVLIHGIRTEIRWRSWAERKHIPDLARRNELEELCLGVGAQAGDGLDDGAERRRCVCFQLEEFTHKITEQILGEIDYDIYYTPSFALPLTTRVKQCRHHLGVDFVGHEEASVVPAPHADRQFGCAR